MRQFIELRGEVAAGATGEESAARMEADGAWVWARVHEFARAGYRVARSVTVDAEPAAPGGPQRYSVTAVMDTETGTRLKPGGHP